MADTTRERIYKLLDENLAGPMTATEISQLLDIDLASLSSLLKKMCDDPKGIYRIANYGPRGGYGYYGRLR